MTAIATLTLNPTVDKSSRVDRVVAERKLRCAMPRFEPGGGGLNVSRAIGYLGGQSQAVWTKGGAVGDLLAELLSSERIEHRPIPVSGMTRQNLIIYEECSGEQYRFGMPCPEMSEADAEACLRVIGGLDPAPDYLVISGSQPPGLPDAFCRRFLEVVPAGARLIVDTSGGPLKAALGRGLFLIKPNLRELGQLVGRDLESDAEIERAARELCDTGQVEIVLVSVGAGGAVLVTCDACRAIRSPTVPMRSKVGAGDSMVAGTVLALSRGDDPIRAAMRGVAAGAAAVMTPGTRLCRREDAERLFAEMPE